MMKHWKVAVLAVVCLSVVAAFGWKTTFSHCQVPCGIYNDELRFEMIYNQNITTIEKAMKQIEELSADPGKNANQLARWVVNKEEHAEDIMHMMQQYFLAQRIKPAEEGEAYKKYVEQLVLVHKIIVTTMKTKQTTDLENVETLKDLVDQFYKSYFGKEHKKHSH